MSSQDEFPGLSTPFGCKEEIASTTRYSWDNKARDTSSYVIIQSTISGNGRFVFRGKSWDVPPGNAFVAIVPEPSSYFFPPEVTEPWAFSWLNIYGGLGIRLAEDLRRRHGPILPLPRGSAAHVAFEGLCERAALRRPANPWAMAARAFDFFMEWARFLTDPVAGNEDLVERCLQICRFRYREPLGVKTLADSCGVSREHLTRVFTAATGISPAVHLRNIRAEAAAGMIGEASSLKDLAMRCGFPSVRAMHRALAERRS